LAQSTAQKKTRRAITYSEAGVDISRADKAKQRIKYLAQKTFNRSVLSDIGSFGGLFSLGQKYRDPVLVSSADGVGTKLKVAFEMNLHHTVGADLVNHCVNDIAVQGQPRFFSSTTSPAGDSILRSRRRWSPVSPKLAVKTAAL